MTKVLKCWFEEREFELHSRYYVHFQTITFGEGINPLNLLDMG